MIKNIRLVINVENPSFDGFPTGSFKFFLMIENLVHMVVSTAKQEQIKPRPITLCPAIKA
jgi:hypothetical protein